MPGPWSDDKGFLCWNASFSPDGKILAAIGRAIGKPPLRGSGIVLWDVVAIGKELRTLIDLGSPQQMITLAFADGGKTLVSAARDGVKWWDVATGKELRSWLPFGDLPQAKVGPGKKSKSTTFNLVLSPNGTRLAIQVMVGTVEGGGIKAADGETLLFDLASSKVLWRVKGQGAVTNVFNGGAMKKSSITLNRLVFSADGKRVALAVGPNSVELRDVATGKLVATPALDPKSGGGGIGVLALSPDGNKAAIAGQVGPVMLWNPPEAAALRNFGASTGQYQSLNSRCLTFSPDNKLLLVATVGDLQLYDVATLKAVNAHAGHREPVDTVVFSPDGQRLLTGSGGEHMLRYGRFVFGPQSAISMATESLAWDTAAWKPMQAAADGTPESGKPGDFSLDRAIFVSRSPKDPFGVYSTASGKLIGRFAVSKSRNINVPGVFSPSGKFYLLTGGANAQAVDQLYALPSCKLVSQWPGAANVVSDGFRRPFSYSADESLIALADSDGFYYVIETATGKVKKRLGTKLEGDENLMEFLMEIPPRLALSPDGKRLATWNLLSDVIVVWDLRTGKQLVLHTHAAEQFGVNGFFQKRDGGGICSWSPDSRRAGD